MTRTTAPRTTTPQNTAQSLSLRLFGAGLGAAELMTVYLGLKVGLYECLAQRGPATPIELADRAGIAPRYATEWLEQQAASGIVLVDDPDLAAHARRYTLPVGHAEALTDQDSPFSIAPMVVLPIAGLASLLPMLADAFRSGDGIPYALYGDALRGGSAGLNKAVFTHELPGWIAKALPDIHASLSAGGVRIADVACGSGWSSIALARTYPGVHVDGLDLDPGSVADAVVHAREEGLSDRITFAVRDAADPALAGRYQLVCVFDALHDMAAPVSVLRACRALLAPGGAVLLMEPNVGERFTAPATDAERFQYAVSVLHCLPVGMADQPSAATGTVMRPSTVRAYAAEAGLTAQVLAVRHPFHRLYRLTPAHPST